MKTKLERLFTLEECSDIINFIKDKPEWEYVHDVDKNGNTLSRYHVLPNVDSNEFVSNKFKKFIDSHLLVKVDKVTVYALKYLPGYSFGRHTDRIQRKDKNQDFVFNINVVLNDDFKGGEFWLDDMPLEGNTPGMVYYYNSTQWHEVKEITDGVRYSILCFVRERDYVSKKTKSLL